MKCHECNEIYDSTLVSHTCYKGQTIYYIQYRHKTSLEHIPHRFTIIAKDLIELSKIIDRQGIQDQIDILASEKK